MRAKSKKNNGFTIYAVSGTHSISFAIDFREADTKGLLGFAVEKIDKTNGERKFVDGFKVFKELVPDPGRSTVINTYMHPVQSFVWDDFSCYDNTDYDYLFYPLGGKPAKLDRSLSPILISITTEAMFGNNEHDIFFNRGAASSQAYRKRFFNLAPDQIINPEMKEQAMKWLSRQLDDAILAYIAQAKAGDTLLGCFYEFQYMPVLKAFKDAIDAGVNVKLIIDAKKDNAVDELGKIISEPRTKNLEAVNTAGITESNIILREAEKEHIQHNKFIVYIKGDKPMAVWSGSTNITTGGVHGQTNVGHWVKNEEAALKYKLYWDILKTDPGASADDDAVTKKKKRSDLKKAVEQLQANIKFESWDSIPVGITPVFSPRNGTTMLETYVNMFNNAEKVACVTLAFGINKLFKDYLSDNSQKSHLSLLLLEKEDQPNKKSREPFVFIGSKQNVYKSWGSFIEDDLHQWARETSTRELGLNKHVAFIHSKFLLVDPLSNDPVVVTGSANFSKASTNDNDENMMIIRGDKRVADIYFTEFNRLFHHYYFRAIYNKAHAKDKDDGESLYLSPNDKWLEHYKKGSFRYKRIEMLSQMEGFKK